MDIIGTGIPTAIRLEFKQDFRPDIQLALKWAQLASGNWIAADRGAAADVRQCKIRITGYEQYINDIIMALYNNRIATTGTPNVLTLSNFTDTEKIFGEDVDYTVPISATVIEVAERQQTSLYTFQLELALQVISPTFTGSAGTITLEHFEEAYKGYAEPTINKYDTYNGTFSYLDRMADAGIFEGTATLTNANMVTFLRSLATQRGAPVTTTIMNGINNVFGPTRNNTWPKNLVYLEVKDLGYWGLNRHKVQIKAAEYITTPLTYAATIVARGPISYWRLNEESGTTATDTITTQDGTYTGTITLGETGPSAVANSKSAYFNGGYVDIAHNNAHFGMENLLIEFWMKPASESDFNIFGGYSYYAKIWDDVFEQAFVYDNAFYGYSILSSFTLTLDQWYYVVIVLNGTSGAKTFNLYIDGNLINTQTNVPDFSTVNASSSYGLNIAARTYAPPKPFNGHICEFAIYDYDWYTGLTHKDWWNYL